MNWHIRLAAFCVILALAGCAQGIPVQDPDPYAPYSHNDREDMHNGSDGGGGSM
jgi:hypothetical protein